MKLARFLAAEPANTGVNREFTLAVLLALGLTGWHSSAKLSLRLTLECQAPRGSPGWAPAVGRRIAKNAAANAAFLAEKTAKNHAK